MREAQRSGDAKPGAPASERHSEPPSSSRFIGTNIDAAQAYVPPTALPETPEPPVPDSKVSLAAEVDPRKVPTQPNLKKAAKAIVSERPPPIIEAPPDSQPSGMRRGAGYAPSRSNFPPPLTPRSEASQRVTPVKPFPKVSQRPPAPDAAETPAQRRAAVFLIFLFAALLAVAVYFFLRRAPAPPTETPPSPSGSASAPLTSSVPAPPSVSPPPTPSAEPSEAPTATATASASASPTSSQVFVPSRPSGAPTSEPPTSAPPASQGAAPSAAPTPTGSEKPKSGRWF